MSAFINVRKERGRERERERDGQSARKMEKVRNGVTTRDGKGEHIKPNETERVGREREWSLLHLPLRWQMRLGTKGNLILVIRPKGPEDFISKVDP